VLIRQPSTGFVNKPPRLEKNPDILSIDNINVNYVLKRVKCGFFHGNSPTS